MTTVRDAQNAIDLVAGILRRWRRTLSQVAEGLEPEARYEQDTDAPSNLEARVQSRLIATVDDEITPLLDNLAALGQMIETEANEGSW